MNIFIPRGELVKVHGRFPLTRESSSILSPLVIPASEPESRTLCHSSLHHAFRAANRIAGTLWVPESRTLPTKVGVQVGY